MLVRATSSASSAQLREWTAESRSRVCLLSQLAPDPEAVLEAPEYVVIWAGGPAAVSVNGVWRGVSGDRLMIARPGNRVQLRVDPAARGPVCVVSVPRSRIRACLEDLHDVSHRFRRLADNPEPLAGISGRILWQDSGIGPVLAGLEQAAALGMKDPGWMNRQTRLLLERLLFMAARAGTSRPGQRPSRRELLRERLERVKVLIDTRYAEPINLAAMAETACVSRYHFLREFRRAYGETPYRLLLNRRLQAARDLLVSRDLSVQEISQRVGFSSADGFYRAFRRRYRASPSAFRGTV
jgi:AraC-like DNA-binding protein